MVKKELLIVEDEKGFRAHPTNLTKTEMLGMMALITASITNIYFDEIRKERDEARKERDVLLQSNTLLNAEVKKLSALPNKKEKKTMKTKGWRCAGCGKIHANFDDATECCEPNPVYICEYCGGIFEREGCLCYCETMENYPVRSDEKDKEKEKTWTQALEQWLDGR